METKEKSNPRVIVPGVVIALACLGTTVVSRVLDEPWLVDLESVFLFLAIQSVALAAYIVALRFVAVKHLNVSVIAIVGFAVLFRVVALAGEPLFDDDIYRYVWDGKVTANGINPYKHAPADVTLPPFDALGDPSKSETLEELDHLNELWFETSQETALFERINYPDVRTIYPPVTQGVFALAYAVAPTPELTVTTFKVVLTFLDVMAVLLIIAALRRLEINPCFSIVYAWHPLVIKEIAGTGHMESIPVFLIVLGVYLLVSSRRVMSVGAIALGVCSKLVPVLALPFFGVELYRTGRAKLLLGGLVSLFVVGICYLPFVDAGELLFSGTGAFADKWEMNAGPFELTRWAVAVVTPARIDASFVARVIVVVMLGAVMVTTFVRGAENLKQRVGQVFIVLVTAYLLSPVQNPWYICWSLPLLCFNFKWSWIALSVPSVLYYVYFALAMNPGNINFDLIGPSILVLQYAPFVILFVLENRFRFAKPKG